MRTSTTVRTGIIAVEKIHATITLQPEAPAVIESTRPEPEWPAQEALEFSNISAEHFTEGQIILHGVSFRVLPGEHVGVAGGTGAGKSSLTILMVRYSLGIHIPYKESPPGSLGPTPDYRS